MLWPKTGWPKLPLLKNDHIRCPSVRSQRFTAREAIYPGHFFSRRLDGTQRNRLRANPAHERVRRNLDYAYAKDYPSEKIFGENPQLIPWLLKWTLLLLHPNPDLWYSCVPFLCNVPHLPPVSGHAIGDHLWPSKRDP